MITKRDHKKRGKVSLKYMEPNDKGSDLKIASLFSVLQNFALKLKAHFLQSIMSKI